MLYVKGKSFMPPEQLSPDDPRQWLKRAHSDLSLAKSQVSGVLLEDLCFHTQQAAEKAFKALLIHKSIKFRYVHDLAELISVLEAAIQDIPDEIRDAARLTDYAVEARYPSCFEPVTADEYKEALACAENVIRWVEKQIEGV